MNDLTFRPATEQDLERCFAIESSAYEGDEAASKEKILTRIKTYPQGFLVLENSHEIVGFINAGACHKVELSDESFKELIGHDPQGKFIVIMSVVVDKKYQRLGFAKQLMTEFIKQMQALGKSDIYLICEQKLVDMYASHGFVYLGESDSDHGGLKWHEMSLKIS